MSQSARSAGSVVTRSREGSAPSILAQAATTFSSARQADASLRASRIVSPVVVETAASPVAIAPLPAIPGALVSRAPAHEDGFLSRSACERSGDAIVRQSTLGSTRPVRRERRLSMAENGNGKFGGREVVIVEAVRTPIGRGHAEKGYYKDLHPSNLLAKAYSELVRARRRSTPPRSSDVSPAASSSSASRASTSAATPGSRPACRSRPRRRRSTASAAPPSRRSTSPRR